MTRYQKLTLLILALIFVAVVALVAVTALRPGAQTTVIVTPTTSLMPALSSEDMTLIHGMQQAAGVDLSALSFEEQTRSAISVLTQVYELIPTFTAQALGTATPSA